MDKGIFQCIPNVSEGCSEEIVELIAKGISSVKNVKLLDYSKDSDHNRSVFTFIGAAFPLKEAMLRIYDICEKKLDINKHKGAHPRIGIVDVVPFVPLEKTTMAEAKETALDLAHKVVENFNVPVYLYEESSLIPQRKSLAFIRKGSFETLINEIHTDLRKPDLGPAKMHPLLGASCIGARFPLLAFNVLLNTPDVEIAKAIAKKIRAKDGGLGYVRALGIFLKERGLAQVSMNLLDTKKSALYTAFEMVKMEAKRFGVGVLSSQLIGVMQLDALADTAAYYLQMEDFDSSRVLERGQLNMAYDQL